MKTAYFNSAAPKVGDVVYPGFTPALAGRIVGVADGEMPINRPNGTVLYTHKGIVLRIRQPNGKEYSHTPLGLKCFQTLVEDHERKAKKHRATLETIQAMTTTMTTA